jgi:hypothetical protein
VKKSYRPRVDLLEDRITPFGVPWPDGLHLTVSFVADGTNVAGASSNLFQMLNAQSATTTWKMAVLRAFQTWAVNANVNFGLVPDGGQALGTPGAPQHDARFGDVRIAARPMAANTVALGTPFSWSGSTWCGDTLFNNTYTFSVNGGPGQYDLYTVALHEAGHALGLPDNPSDPQSPMYPSYKGPRTGLDANDIANIRALYGVRQADRFDAGNPDSSDPSDNSNVPNNSFATAAVLNSWSGMSPAFADLTSLSDVDYYKIQTPANDDYAGFTWTVKTSGISLLAPSVTIYDASRNVVSSAAATDPLNGDITLNVAATGGTTYYIKVDHARADVFGIGAYQFSVRHRFVGYVPSTLDPLDTFTFHNDHHSNESLANATNLTRNNMANGIFTYLYGGNILNSADVDYYVLNTPDTPAGISHFTMTAAAWAANLNGVNPVIHFFDSDGTPLAGRVLTNNNGAYTIQLANVAPDEKYYVEVAPNPQSANGVGNYTLAVNVDTSTPVALAALGSQTLNSAVTTISATLTVNQNGCFNFVLGAQPVGSSTDAIVTMSLYDTAGNLVLSLSVSAGQPPVTTIVFLQAGTYTVRYRAQSKSGGPLAPVTYWLGGQLLTDPIGPLYTDPNAPPPDPNAVPPSDFVYMDPSSLLFGVPYVF